jgi:hypothetical protein
MTRPIRHANLENFLCDINRDQSIVSHDGLLFLLSHSSDFGTSMPIKSQEESISSMNPTKPAQAMGASRVILSVWRT